MIRISAVLIALSCAVSVMAADDFITPVHNGDKANYEKKHNMICDGVRKIKPDVLFVGDSITEGWIMADRGLPVWNRNLKELKAADFGCSGDKTQNVLWRLENADWKGISPKVVVLMIGINNGDRGQQVFDAQKKIIEKINGLFPKTKIIFIPVLPIKKADKTIIVSCNKMAPGLEKDFPNVTVLDMSAKFLGKDGGQISELFIDGVHPNTKGYEVWASEIVPVIKKLLKETSK